MLFAFDGSVIITAMPGSVGSRRPTTTTGLLLGAPGTDVLLLHAACVFSGVPSNDDDGELHQRY